MALKRKTRIYNKGLSKAFAENSSATWTRSTVTGATSAVQYNAWPRGFRGYQITDSEGHPWFPKKSRPEGDIGGPFKTRKIYVSYMSHKDLHSATSAFTVETNHLGGYAIPSPSDSIVTLANVLNEGKYPDYSSSDNELNAAGATAISLCNPVNPVFDASVTIAELYREGLPSVMMLKAFKDRSLSSLGDEFLNWQFGIKPILDAVADLQKSLKTQDQVMKQLRRDSGRQVRRSFEFPTTRQVVSDTSNTGAVNTSVPNAYWQGVSLTGITRKLVTVEKTRWFSGAFTYHLPDTDVANGLARMALEADASFGIVPDLETLWNLIPWSWAVDWFANVGHNLNNLSNMAKYGLVMPYAYMMEHTIVKYEYTFTPNSGILKGGPISLTILDETKKRVKASPFGFGVSWDGFDTTQLAILAALGLSRSPF